MSQRSIEDFKSVLRGGGIRPTMYEVTLTPPVTANWYGNSYDANLRDLTFLCKAAQIPSSTLTTMSIGLPAGGALKFPGSRIFEPWNIKIINDDKMRIRALFENWSRALMGREVQTSSSPLISDQYAIAEVLQLDRMAQPVRGYRFVGMYPTAIVAQELSYENQDTISDFDVTLDYQYWEPFEYLNRSPVFSAEIGVSAELLGVNAELSGRVQI